MPIMTAKTGFGTKMGLKSQFTYLPVNQCITSEYVFTGVSALCKRPSIARRKAAFCNAVDRFLRCNQPCFTVQLAAFRIANSRFSLRRQPFFMLLTGTTDGAFRSLAKPECQRKDMPMLNIQNTEAYMPRRVRAWPISRQVACPVFPADLPKCPYTRVSPPK